MYTTIIICLTVIFKFLFTFLRPKDEKVFEIVFE